MIDFDSVIRNLRETVNNYEKQLTEIDRFLAEKGLLDDYQNFAKRKTDEKQREDNKQAAEKIAEQKKEEEAEKAEEEKLEEKKESKNDKDPGTQVTTNIFDGAVSFILISSSLQVIGEKLYMKLAGKDGSEVSMSYSVYDNSMTIEDETGKSPVLMKVQKRKLLRLLAQVPKMAPEASIPQNVCNYLRPVELAVRHENIVRNYPDWDYSDIGAPNYEEYINEHPDSSEMDYFDYITDKAVRAFAEPSGKERGRYMAAYAELSEAYDDAQISDGFKELGEIRQRELGEETEQKRTERRKQL